MVLIIGAGLSGLLTAYRLKKAGIPFKILEARGRIGGRIYTTSTKDSTPVEMGATWLNSQHRNLLALLEELGLSVFEQRMGNSYYFQATSAEAVGHYQLPTNQNPSYRIAGGTSQLIQKLANSLNQEDILLNQQVKSVKVFEADVVVEAQSEFLAKQVIFTLSPKLWANQISFEPQFPQKLLSVAQHTQTWMEDSTKVAISYATPFWEKDGIASTIFANEGPLTEFYDHSDVADKQFALCGFLHPAYAQLDQTKRKEAVLHQLTQIYGKVALDFTDYQEKRWFKDGFTHFDSPTQLLPHQNNGHAAFRESYFGDRIILSGTETTSAFAGYMEGAVISADRAVRLVLERVAINQKTAT